MQSHGLERRMTSAAIQPTAKVTVLGEQPFRQLCSAPPKHQHLHWAIKRFKFRSDCVLVMIEYTLMEFLMVRRCCWWDWAAVSPAPKGIPTCEGAVPV